MIVMFLVAGCADMDLPTPNSVLKKPLGTDSVKIGMTKDEVRSLWGDPDSIDTEVVDNATRSREVWTYKARTQMPLDAGYLSKTRKLYFDDINLTKISE